MKNVKVRWFKENRPSHVYNTILKISDEITKDFDVLTDYLLKIDFLKLNRNDSSENSGTMAIIDDILIL
ncbi:MAG: hypothetical protein SPK65_09140 [Succinivibrio dextrinosolvens]|nr:hypothetical protein [Succinivibrio dextrinosolvens]MDY6466746.1 hypothetical protein [Succinivibrio dextrinosolvens]